MRWTARPPRKRNRDIDGDQRVVRRLLLTPLMLDGEYRWLEWADIQQRYNDYWGMSREGWVDAHWN